MGVLITSSNFVGKFAIPQNSFSSLDAFINASEETYLVELLGANLYNSFKSNLTNKVPVATNYLAIYNPFFEDFQEKICKSKGMVEMLCGFIYFDYMRNIKFKATTQGITTMVSDTGEKSAYGNLYVLLNEATETYIAIQNYIQFVHPELYTSVEFNGSKKCLTIPIF